MSKVVDEILNTHIKTLYKYCKMSKYTEAIFVKNELYFAPPAKFNDPFDTRINYVMEGNRHTVELFIKKILKKYTEFDKKRRRAILKNPSLKQDYLIGLYNQSDSHRTEIGILSLTIKNDNILMWAHYAENNTGFCLIFDGTNEFFSKSIPVNYDKKLLVINVLKKPDNYTMEDMILTKSEDWEYEQEWRIVKTPSLGGPGVRKFPEESLKGIIFGCDMKSKDKEKILSWCNTRKYKPKLYNAEPKKEEYGLIIKLHEHGEN